MAIVTTTADEHKEFELIPMAADSINDKMSMHFRLSELDMSYLVSRNGQQTAWRFQNVIRNEDLDDALFEFQPPAGIEVIENTYSQ